MSQDFQPPSYPVVQFLVARGKGLSIALSALVFLGVAGLGLASGSLWLLPAGVVGAAVLLGLLLSYVEVLRIIADTLLPKY
jgi:predicted small integral membrane protein